MADFNIKVDMRVVNSAYRPYLHAPNRTQIFFGGSSSGKSVFLAQRAVLDVASGDHNYLICRAVGRSIRNSVFNEVRRVINNFGLADLFSINKSEFIITCLNGNQILFAGLDDVEKLKSIIPEKGVLTDVWIEEATETDLNSVKQLFKRQRGGSEKIKKRLTMSFNPIFKHHWIFTTYFALAQWAEDQKVFDMGELLIVKTTHLDNMFLTTQDHIDLENEGDKYFRDVYTLGNWGVLGNVIFTNWSYADLDALRDQFTLRRTGLDFGYGTDPAAVGRTHYDRKKKIIYVFDELYQRGFTNDQLAIATLQLLGETCKRDMVVCDSAEPKSIMELCKYGVNAVACRKGADSVLFGIQWLQQQTILVDRKCINTGNEFQIYRWKEDKNGNTLPIPVDKMDHLISALRYAYEDESLAAKNLMQSQPVHDSRWLISSGGGKEELTGWTQKFK